MHTAKLAVDFPFPQKMSRFPLRRLRARGLGELTLTTNTSYLFSVLYIYTWKFTDQLQHDRIPDENRDDDDRTAVWQKASTAKG
jgi:hypothetical protein